MHACAHSYCGLGTSCQADPGVLPADVQPAGAPEGAWTCHMAITDGWRILPALAEAQCLQALPRGRLLNGAVFDILRFGWAGEGAGRCAGLASALRSGLTVRC